MDVDAFVEGQLLWIIFGIFFVTLGARILFFFNKIITSSRGKPSVAVHILLTTISSLLPFHRAVSKKPGYAVLRYFFHICLFVVPIWLVGHVTLWTESRFEWDWISLPDPLADLMTLGVLALAVFFLIRRIFWPDVRSDSSVRDFFLILFTALPFLSGFFLTHGTLDGIDFFRENIRRFHVISGEIMLLMATFLFYKTRLNPKSCTGCASCELSCPTGTLESKDQGGKRTFAYSHYQCICCGSCVQTCPEGAAHLRHDLNPARLFQILSKREIRTVDMKVCERCGEFFVPEPLYDKIGRTFKDDYLHFCPNCRKTKLGELYRKLSPWNNPSKATSEASLFIQR